MTVSLSPLLTDFTYKNIKYLPGDIVTYPVFKELNFFTGSNNQGKTILLDILFYIMTGKWNRITSYQRPIPKPYHLDESCHVYFKYNGKEYTSPFIREDQEWYDGLLENRKKTIAIYAMDNNNFSIYTGFGKKDIHFKLEEHEVINGRKNNVGYGGILYNIHRWKYTLKEKYRNFIYLLSIFNDGRDIKMEFTRSTDFYEVIEYPEFLGMGLNPHSFQYMDSGVRRIIELCALLIWIEEKIEVYNDPNSDPINFVLIMDKMESGLHPIYQENILKIVFKWLSMNSKNINQHTFQLFSTTYSDIICDSLRKKVLYENYDNEKISIYHKYTKDNMLMFEYMKMDKNSNFTESPEEFFYDQFDKNLTKFAGWDFMNEDIKLD